MGYINKRKITTSIQDANLRARLDELRAQSVTNENRASLINELEAIDTLLHNAMTTDINKGVHSLPTWWSPELRNAKLSVVYWELRRVQRITGMSMDDGIQSVLDQLPADHPLQDRPNDKHIEAMIRRCKLRVREAV